MCELRQRFNCSGTTQMSAMECQGVQDNVTAYDRPRLYSFEESCSEIYRQ